MTRYAAFLRGVNVGGVNLKMAEVATALGNAGFDNVRTILASGNVVLDGAGSAASVRRKAEAALREAFGYDAWVLVYPLDPRKDIVVVDLRLGYRVLGTGLQLKVGNLFQHEYTDVQERTPGPPRSISLTAFRGF